jgi:hypothetical protein
VHVRLDPYTLFPTVCEDLPFCSVELVHHIPLCNEYTCVLYSCGLVVCGRALMFTRRQHSILRC